VNNKYKNKFIIRLRIKMCFFELPARHSLKIFVFDLIF